MSIIALLHNLLKEKLPSIHATWLQALMAAVEAGLSGASVSITALGWALSGPATIKHTCLFGCCPLTAFRSLLGIAGDVAAPTYAEHLSQQMPNAYFANLGLFTMKEAHRRACQSR
jgi:hypothetical protein